MTIIVHLIDKVWMVSMRRPDEVCLILRRGERADMERYGKNVATFCDWPCEVTA